MTTVLIADVHAIVRRGVREILSESELSLEIDEAGLVADVIKLARDKQYDIILLDISFPDGNGLDAFHQINAACPETRVLFLSMYPEEHYARRVLKAGAYGYLTKDSASTELTVAMRRVLDGNKYVTLSLAEQLADALGSGTKETPHESLSDREYQVMLALAGGKTISEIAAELSLSSKTVSTYRSRVLEKLRLRSTADLVRYVMNQGLGD